MSRGVAINLLAVEKANQHRSVSFEEKAKSVIANANPIIAALTFD